MNSKKKKKSKHSDSSQEMALSQLTNTIEKFKTNENTDSSITASMALSLGFKIFDLVEKIYAREHESTNVANNLAPKTPTSDKKNNKRKLPEDSPESKENADKEKSKTKKHKTDQPSTESNSTTNNNNNNSNKTPHTTINSSEKTSGEPKKKKHKDVKPAETTSADTESS